MLKPCPEKKQAFLSFGRDVRLRKRKEFIFVQRSNIRVSSRFLLLLARPQKVSDIGRIGLAVSKKVGAAHERNLIKRRLRHIARTHRHIFLNKLLVIVAHPPAASLSFEQLRHELLESAQLLQKRMEIQGKNVARFN